MAIPKRHASAPGTYFVTSRTWESRALFKTDPACRLFADALISYRDKGSYSLHGFVLMPDHFHVLLTPAETLSLERVVQYIKGGSARIIGQELRFKFPVWQRGFSDHRIRDRRDYDTHLRYIEQNPVKKGLADLAGEYVWSSASGQFGMEPPPQRLKPLEQRAADGTAEAVP